MDPPGILRLSPTSIPVAKLLVSLNWLIYEFPNILPTWTSAKIVPDPAPVTISIGTLL